MNILISYELIFTKLSVTAEKKKKKRAGVLIYQRGENSLMYLAIWHNQYNKQHCCHGSILGQKVWEEKIVYSGSREWSLKIHVKERAVLVSVWKQKPEQGEASLRQKRQKDR